jgi:Protein of unknown function (DUF2958)
MNRRRTMTREERAKKAELAVHAAYAGLEKRLAEAGDDYESPNPICTDAMVEAASSVKDEEDPLVLYRYFFSGGAGEWYVVEAKQQRGDVSFFGYVDMQLGDGQGGELGYFTLRQLRDEVPRTPFYRCELDRFFTPCRLSEITKLGDRAAE